MGQRTTIGKQLLAILVSARPAQWLKNLSIFAAVTFWGDLHKIAVVAKLGLGFAVFCALSSAMYLVNDLIDAPQDRRHPVKRKRPIASGALLPRTALAAAAFLAVCALPTAFLLSPYFFVLSLTFVALQLFYSFFLRQLIILDALTVAMTFILRVYAGAWLIPVPISSFLVLTTIGLAMLLAFGKRRCERTLLGGAAATRRTLKRYPDSLLDAMISTSASFAIISYAVFAFQTSPRITSPFLSPWLPITTAQPKWMMLTIPLVIYGIARYLYVIYEKKEGESPEKVLLSDFPLLASVFFWVVLVLGIVYFLS